VIFATEPNKGIQPEIPNFLPAPLNVPLREVLQRLGKTMGFSNSELRHKME
jgi:hypothetical protein